MTSEESAKLLDKAALLCVTAHQGQRDKMGKAYFQHPMRVAMRCQSDDEKIVALLHDVLEDTPTTPEDLLAQRFPQYIVDGILSVTKRDGESYEDFVARAKQNPLGRVVKLHDLEDNLDVLRLDSVSPEMAARFSKYLAARQFLLSEDEPSEKGAEQIEAIAERPIRTIDELYRDLRKDANRYIRQRAKHTGGSNYMHDLLIIRDKDKTVLSESSIADTMTALGRMLGFATIADAGVRLKTKYKLVTTETNSDSYVKANSSWYVISKTPVVVVAEALNELFDKLNSRLIAYVVDR